MDKEDTQMDDPAEVSNASARYSRCMRVTHVQRGGDIQAISPHMLCRASSMQCPS